MSATLLSRRELLYSEGPDRALDRPAHVRAGSSLAWLGNRIAVIQDDANFVALIDPDTLRADSWPLPAGVGGLRQFDDLRGNKRFKRDLEACFNVHLDGGEMLVALGSGSSEHRETVVLIDATGISRLFEASGLYAQLRSEKGFSGSELNVEGAVSIDGRVRLFNRGNGACRDGMLPLNATCDISWPEFYAYLQLPAQQAVPKLRNIAQYDLGDLQGAPLSFTDATTTESGIFLYTATAENSPDAVTDGEVTGSVIGILDSPTGCRWIELRNAEGGLVVEKIEGICPGRERDGQIYVILDADDPARPSVLCEVELKGPWFVPPNSPAFLEKT